MLKFLLTKKIIKIITSSSFKKILTCIIELVILKPGHIPIKEKEKRTVSTILEERFNITASPTYHKSV